MFCKRCGTKLEDYEDTCYNCGYKNYDDDSTRKIIIIKSTRVNLFGLFGFIFSILWFLFIPIILIFSREFISMDAGVRKFLFVIWGLLPLLTLVFSLIGITQVSDGKGTGRGFGIAGICIFATVFVIALMVLSFIGAFSMV